MRKLLSSRITVRLILAALAAGGLTLPAVAQGTAPKSTHPSTAHHSTKHSSSKTASPSKSTAAKGAATASPKSARSSGKKSTTHKSVKGVTSKNSRRIKGQAAPIPERVNEIQDALAKNGAYSGAPTGKWDDSTTDAMKKFQSAHGLNPNGKMDARTLQALGLGSETAGAGAPTPPPNTANRLLSSSNHRD